MSSMHDGRRENDNSKEYRIEREKQTKILLKRALLFIHDSDKNFSQKNICSTMEILASKEDIQLKAVITSSAISKNDSYKLIIKTYKIQNDVFKDKLKKYDITQGDAALELHKYKTLLAQKSDEVMILKDIINKEDLSFDNNKIEINKPEFDYKVLLKESYKIMLRDGLIFELGGKLVLEADTSSVIANKQLINELGLDETF